MEPSLELVRVSTPHRDVAMTAFVLALILSYIWIWQDAFNGAPAVLTLALACALIAGHIERGESLRDAGLRLDTLGAALAILAPVTAIVIGAALLIGGVVGSVRFPPPAFAAASIGEAMAFGLVQQYVLLGFFYPRLAGMLPGRAAAAVATAAVFALCHLPNAFLTAVTFGAGLIATSVYRRAPNLWAIGAAHGLISFTIYYSLPIEVTGALRVGPGYSAS
jgi:membrane protease YdiL (CAAX protease family)